MRKLKKIITSLLAASIMMPTIIASATTSMSAPQLGQWVVSGGQQGSYETPLYGQYNPYTYPASQQAQNATWGQIRDGIITNFASQVISGILNGGNTSTSQGTGTYITDGEGRQVPITRQNGAIQTPGNDTSYVWWTVKPENNKTRGVFQASIVADPPHPLDGRPIRGKLRIATVSNMNMLRGFFDDKEVQLHQVRQGLWESGWFEMEKEAAFGTYDPRHAFSVIGQSNYIVGTMAGTISYTVDKFAAMGTNGSGSGTYSSIDAIQSNYKTLQDNKNSSIGGEADVTGTITGMESKDGKTVMTITEDSGKSIQVIAADSNRLPTGLKTGDKIRAVGLPTKNVDGTISLNATALTAPGVKSEKNQMQINNGKPTEKKDIGANSLADIMKLGQEEEAKIKGQQGGSAPAPSGGGSPNFSDSGSLPNKNSEKISTPLHDIVAEVRNQASEFISNIKNTNTELLPGVSTTNSKKNGGLLALGIIASAIGLVILAVWVGIPVTAAAAGFLGVVFLKGIIIGAVATLTFAAVGALFAHIPALNNLFDGEMLTDIVSFLKDPLGCIFTAFSEAPGASIATLLLGFTLPLLPAALKEFVPLWFTTKMMLLSESAKKWNGFIGSRIAGIADFLANWTASRCVDMANNLHINQWNPGIATIARSKAIAQDLFKNWKSLYANSEFMQIWKSKTNELLQNPATKYVGEAMRNAQNNLLAFKEPALKDIDTVYKYLRQNSLVMNQELESAQQAVCNATGKTFFKDAMSEANRVINDNLRRITTNADQMTNFVNRERDQVLNYLQKSVEGMNRQIGKPSSLITQNHINVYEQVLSNYRNVHSDVGALLDDITRLPHVNVDQAKYNASSFYNKMTVFHQNISEAETQVSAFQNILGNAHLKNAEMNQLLEQMQTTVSKVCTDPVDSPQKYKKLLEEGVNIVGKNEISWKLQNINIGLTDTMTQQLPNLESRLNNLFDKKIKP